MIALRPYQSSALDAAREQFRAGKRRVLLVAPTGAGKTVIFSMVALGATTKGARVLVVVHRRELIKQTIAKMRAAGIERVGVVAAGFEADTAAAVQIASIQTLIVRDALPPADLLVLDEAHHFVAESWGQIAARYSSARIVGVTATPERSDGTPLGDLFDSLVVVAQVPELIEQGFLAPIDVIAPARKTRTLCADPILSWREHAGERPGVVFASSVAAAREIAARFIAHGIAAACVDGEMTAEDRDDALARFDSGEIRVLTNMYVLTEGWDAPRAEVCMLARGCSSAGTYLQMVGRVLRPHPGKASARLIDLRGVVHDHGLPDEAREFSLNGRAISGGNAPVKTCPACSLVMPIATRACPSCAFEFPAASCDPDLAGLTKIERIDRERSYFVEQIERARIHGYRPGWVAHRFQEKFGRFPAKLWREFFPRAAGAA